MADEFPFLLSYRIEAAGVPIEECFLCAPSSMKRGRFYCSNAAQSNRTIAETKTGGKFEQTNAVDSTNGSSKVKWVIPWKDAEKTVRRYAKKCCFFPRCDIATRIGIHHRKKDEWNRRGPSISVLLDAVLSQVALSIQYRWSISRWFKVRTSPLKRNSTGSAGLYRRSSNLARSHCTNRFFKSLHWNNWNAVQFFTRSIFRP